MTDEQMLEAIDEVGKEFGFTRKNVKMAVIHGKDHHHADGRHLHFLVETVNPENNKNFDFKNFQQRQELVARTLEMDNNFQLNKGRHNKYVYSRLYESNPEYAERMKHLTEGRLERKTISEKQIENLRRRGSNPFQMKKELKELWASSENDFDKFAEQLSGAGYSIEQGRKTLIINDRDGKFITGVKNVLNVNDKELATVLEGSETYKKTIASHGMQAPEGAVIPLEGIANATPSKASEKPTEADKATIPTQKPEQQQGKGSGDSMNVEAEKISASDDMSKEQKDAINAINKKAQSDEQDIKDLEERIKERNQILDDLLVPKKQEFSIWDNWKNYLNNEKDKNQYIIDLPHPKLKNVDIKDIRNFIYKNFKGELEEFKKEKDKLKDIKLKIKDLDNALLFRGSRQQKAEKEQQEQIERLTLMAMHLVHSIMYEIGLTKEKPHAVNYMTQQQLNEYKRSYHHNEYAQLFVKCDNIKEAVNAISDRKKLQIEERLLDWSEREEVKDAKEQIRKILRIEKLDINEFNQDEHHKYNERVKNLDINNVNELLTEKNIRISREESEQDNDLTHDNIENDKE
ncbi:MAG: hypothetical protein ABF582_03000 [Acetobacter okinawensis]